MSGRTIAKQDINQNKHSEDRSYQSSERRVSDDVDDKKRLHKKSSFDPYKDNKKKPVFSTLLSDRNVSDNSTVRLMCTLLMSDCDVVWLKNNKFLPVCSKYRTSYDDGTAVLEIFSVSAEDAGDYTCNARNSFGETSTTSRLKVYSGYEPSPVPPIFTRSVKGILFNYNMMAADIAGRSSQLRFKIILLSLPNTSIQSFLCCFIYCQLAFKIDKF